MRLALEEARVAYEAGEVPVGAVVVRDGEVVARGRNRREHTQDPTAHAEIEAMRAAAFRLGDRRLTGCSLYVTLEPCPMCAGAIALSHLARVVYGAHDPAYGCAGSVYRLPEDPAFPGFTPCDGGVLEAECGDMLSRFFAQRRG